MATDAELRDQAVAELQLTTISYPQWVAAGQPPDRWKNGFTLLAQISAPPVPPPPPPTTQFGTLLPPRIPASPGPVVNVTTMTGLRNACASAAYGSIIDGGGLTYNYAGQSGSAEVPDQFTAWDVSRNGNGVVTTLQNCNFVHAMPHIRGKWFRLKNCTALTNDPWGVRLETGQYVDIDNVVITNSVRSGFMVTYGAKDYQIWNSKVINPGSSDTFGAYGVYAESFNSTCVVANCLFQGTERWALHAYSGQPTSSGFPMDGLIFTGCTMIHYPTSPGDFHDRGGMIVSGYSTNMKMVGVIVVGSPTGLIQCDEALSANNRIYGAVEYASTGPNYQAANCAPVAHIVANPLLDSSYRPAVSSPAASIVPSSMHGYLPSLDIAGQARATGDAGCYRVGTAAPPPPPPPPTGAYGASLPARLPETTRTVTTVTTLAALKTAVAAGGDIRISGTINVGSEINLTLTTPGTAGNPNMISGGKLIGRIWIKSQYWRIRGVEITGTPYEGILIARGAPASFIDIDNCWIHHVGSHGIVTDGVSSDIQVWNCLIEQCGQSGPTSAWSYDCISARGTTSRITIGSNLIRPRNGMGVSLYPNPAGVTCVANTIIGGISRGGYAIQGGTNVKIVGDIITGSPTGAFAITSISAPTTTIQDCIQYGNTQGAWATGFTQAATVANLQSVNPAHTADGHLGAGSPAIAYVLAARYPLLPATDRDGDVRGSADAGCYAA